jgi:hypothetical protein
MKDEKFYNLIKSFVFKLYPLVQLTIDKKYIKPTYDKYPSITFNKNGMPSISEYSSERPYKIDEIFDGWDKQNNLDLNSFPEFLALKDFLLKNDKFKSRFLITTLNDENLFDSLIEHTIKRLPVQFLERYFLLNTSKVEDEALLKDIYLEFENYIYPDYLNFDISVPILFLNFDVEEFSIGENIIIRKISEKYQKARFDVRSYSPAILDTVISSATHELVLKNYHLKHENFTFYTHSPLDYESAYPIDKFELFFNSIKIIRNENSGFAQILVYPHNWSDFFKMDLPRLKGISLKKYPNYFDNFYWNKESLPQITESDLKEIALVYNDLLKNENNKIQISNRRLRYSYLRDNEEDSILDIIIALETLLSDNEKSELTYKLSIRISKLLSHFNENYNSVEIFSFMKKIYDYRSAVVHGSNKIESKKEIKINNTQPIKTISLANEYLREVIKILIQYPIYLDPKEIDNLVLNNK